MEDKDERGGTSETDEAREGERRDLAPDDPPSPASQIGRAKQSGGTPASGLEAGVESREGWPMPDHTGTPKEWPQPTID
jgi:hypothetical protein